jgi:drug/metabolite transporter (DMT)-like permease
MRHRPRDDGLFMTVLVNVLLLGAISVFVAKPPWSTKGVVAMVAAGVLGNMGGRLTNLRAIRYIGATRSSIFLTGTPMVAALAGWVALDETVNLVDAVGAVLVMAGLILPIKLRSTAAAVGGHPPSRDRSVWVGYLYAAAAPTLFGLAFVIRKWGLRSYDSAVLGAFIGAVAAYVAVVAIDTGSGRIRERIADNFFDIPWWFVAAGITSSFALLSQFAAFDFLPAWVVGILQGTQGLWTLLLAFIFLRREERIDLAVVTSVVVVAGGIALITATG